MGRRDKELRYCNHCQKETVFSADVSALLIDSVLLNAPYPLIPEGSYRLCQEADCDSIWVFVQKAIDSHEELMVLKTDWSTALIVYADLSGSKLNAKRSNGNIGEV